MASLDKIAQIVVAARVVDVTTFMVFVTKDVILAGREIIAMRVISKYVKTIMLFHKNVNVGSLYFWFFLIVNNQLFFFSGKYKALIVYTSIP